MHEESEKNKSQLLDDLHQLKVENSVLKATQNLFQNGPVVVFKWRNVENWPVEYVSTNVSDVFGYTVDEFYDGDVLYASIIHRSDIEQVAKEVDTASIDGTHGFDHLPYKIIHKDGSIRWLHDHTVVVRNKEGAITHFYGYVFDITQQKVMEKELLEARDFVLFENSPVPLWEEDFTQLYVYFEVLKKQGVKNFRKYFDQNPETLKECAKKIKILRVNREALKLHGAENKAALVNGLDQIFTENSYRVFKEEVIAFATGKQVFESEAEVKTLSGESICVFVSIKIEDGTGDTVTALFATLDISQRKNAEQELARHRNILACVADLSKRFLVSHSWELVMGKALQLLGEAADVSRVYLFENHVDLSAQPLCSQSYEWCVEAIPAQINNPELQYFDWYESGVGDWYELLNQDKVLMRRQSEFTPAEHEILDEQNILSLLIVPLFVDDKFWGFIGFDDCEQERSWSGVEISALVSAASVIGGAIQREQSKQALRESEQRFRGLLESTSDWIWEMNLAGCYTYSSASIENLLGFKVEEIVGASLFELVPEKEVADNQQRFKSIVEQAKSFSSIEHNMRHKDGSCVVLETSGVPIFNQRGVLVGYRGIDRDISERKQAEQNRLFHTEKQKDELIREVHHRIKNHLQGLMGLLKQRASEGCAYHNIVDEAVTQIESIAIVYGLQASQRGAEIYFGQMVEAIILSAGGLTQLSLSMSKGSELGSCEIDRNKAVALALVVHELLVNAIKHFSATSDVREIKIHHLHEAENNILMVSNPGHLPDGFDFNKGEGLGTGLGLVKAMLPGKGAKLDVVEKNGEVIAKIIISWPLLIKK